MAEMAWWQAAKPHKDIRDRRVNETLFAANLGEAVAGRGPREYSDAETFFTKTFLTRGLRELLVDILRTLHGEPGQNPVASLKTSFGGGKTHTELAIYHLLAHPQEALRVPQVRAVVAEAGLEVPPPCRIAVLAGATLNPLGRRTEDGVTINTLWGEMAYQLGGKEAYGLLAANDAQLVSPGEATLAELLRLVGPCTILFDETLHYVDRASTLKGVQGDLAKQTVAFLRELTVAVDTVPRSMLVLTLTASKLEQLSADALDWLARMDKVVDRLASARTPVDGAEIHEIVRQRLFESVNGEAARQAAQRYHTLYAGMGGLPTRAQGTEYEQLMERSYPFHPEFVAVLYERWGSKAGFQLTRGTLRFLALVLQDLWVKRSNASPDLIRPSDISLAESNLRAWLREVAGDPKWEAVIGSDVASATHGQLAKAQAMDAERGDGQSWAEGLAGTVLLYSMGGGENPYAAREEVRLACARDELPDAFIGDTLERFRTRLFYFYYDDARYQFRIEPNVLSLQHTKHTDLQGSDAVTDYVRKTIEDRALGAAAGATGFGWVKFRPAGNDDVPDGEEPKLVVLGFEHLMEGDAPTESAGQAMLDIVERKGSVLRRCPNTLVFCLADADAARRAADLACDYLSWRQVQKDDAWERLGGAQQELVKTQLGETEGAAHKALISAYAWAVVPEERQGKIALTPVRLGAYGPGRLVAPMVWERLTSEGGAVQKILTALTAQTLLQRYARQAWPETETWVTTAQLRARFAGQVGLPMLAHERVLLDALRQGQREGLLAIGHLADKDHPRDQRESYLALYFEEKDLPGNTPEMGEQWLAIRPAMYRKIVDQPAQVSVAEITDAITQFTEAGQPVSVSIIYKYIKGRKNERVDDASFQTALGQALRELGATYAVDAQGATVTTLPAQPEEAIKGFIVPPPKIGKGHGGYDVPAGRRIAVRGKLGSLNELAPLFNKVLKLLSSQNPAEFTISIDVLARYANDPGAAFDASLADGFDPEAFPGLTLEDSKKR